ncbi:uncharacterized protein PG986_010078 [Apiospora aurea]|uniref:Uncharacterized protein n=1 Tax=Apiospora aurea TaxID=335848 RepID=A0ABR1Q9I0_9PEZI
MAGGGKPTRLGEWMHEFPQSSAEEHSVHYMDRLRLRSHIFTASFGALSRWDPKGTSTPGRAAFIGPFVTPLRDHTDIAPLVVQALKEGLSTPSSDGERLMVLLNSFMNAIRVSGAELDLRMAGLCMYHPDHPSPKRFVNLLADIQSSPYHQLRIEPPPRDAQTRVSRMHRLAKRCAHLLDEEGQHDAAKKVLADVERVYSDGFLAYQHWNHGQLIKPT